MKQNYIWKQWVARIDFHVNELRERLEQDMKRLILIFLATMCAAFFWAQSSFAQNVRHHDFPRITQTWSSTFGEIYWLGGYFGTPENILIGDMSKNIETGRWEFKGQWGRMENGAVVMKGDVGFVFTDKVSSKYISDTNIQRIDESSFQGSRTHYDKETIETWDGQYSEEPHKPYFNPETAPLLTVIPSIGMSSYPTINDRLVSLIAGFESRPNLYTRIYAWEKDRLADSFNELFARRYQKNASPKPAAPPPPAAPKVSETAKVPCSQTLVLELMAAGNSLDNIQLYCRN